MFFSSFDRDVKGQETVRVEGGSSHPEDGPEGVSPSTGTLLRHRQVTCRVVWVRLVVGPCPGSSPDSESTSNQSGLDCLCVTMSWESVSVLVLPSPERNGSRRTSLGPVHRIRVVGSGVDSFFGFEARPVSSTTQWFGPQVWGRYSCLESETVVVTVGTDGTSTVPDGSPGLYRTCRW